MSKLWSNLLRLWFRKVIIILLSREFFVLFIASPLTPLIGPGKIPVFSINLFIAFPVLKQDELRAVLKFCISGFGSNSGTFNCFPPPINYIWFLSFSSWTVSACSIDWNSTKHVKIVAYWSTTSFVAIVVFASFDMSSVNLRNRSFSTVCSFLCFVMNYSMS